jgi:hypothetical protein
MAQGQSKQGTAAFNNPFTSGVLLTTKWTNIEPLPPGINFCSSGGTCGATLTLALVGGGSVTIPCLHAQANYCWDTVDQQLDLIQNDAHGNALAIGFDVHAGYHSPAWLSNGLTTINTDTSISGSTGVDAAGVGIFFNGADVSNAQPSGSYSNLGTVSCSSFESLTLGTSSTACSNSQNLTSWLGVTGGNDGGGSCHAVKLPIPYIPTPGLPAVAPVATLYADMLVALHAHSNSYTNALLVSGFGSRLGVIKLGSFMSGEDAEFSLLGGNSSGSNTARLPTEVGVTPPAAVSNCPTSSVAAYWQTLDTGYNPRIVEETWEAVANAVSTSFTVGTSHILLNLDIHGDKNSTFPDISFYESNSHQGSLYTAGTYDQGLDGPWLQDDVVLCDLIGTAALGSSITIGNGGGNVNTTLTVGPFNSGFTAPLGGHCLTTGYTHAHQPLTYSLTSNSYTWGIEQDGLIPYLPATTSSAGTYAHAMASLGLALSWGTNQGGNKPDGTGDGGAACDSNNDGCSAYATSASALCPPSTGPSSTTCGAQFDAMLSSGLFKFASTSTTYGVGNPSYQFYTMYPIDMCNPYLWPALQNTYAALTGVSLTTNMLTGTYTDCNGNSGTFVGGVWTPS